MVGDGEYHLHHIFYLHKNRHIKPSYLLLFPFSLSLFFITSLCFFFFCVLRKKAFLHLLFFSLILCTLQSSAWWSAPLWLPDSNPRCPKKWKRRRRKKTTIGGVPPLPPPLLPSGGTVMLMCLEDHRTVEIATTKMRFKALIMVV